MSGREVQLSNRGKRAKTSWTSTPKSTDTTQVKVLLESDAGDDEEELSSGYDTDEETARVLQTLEAEPEVKLSTFYKHLKGLQKSRVSCLQLPLVVFVFATYLLVSQSHFMVDEVHELEVAIEEVYLSKKTASSRIRYKDIHSVDLYWEWLTDVFVPTTFNAQTDVLDRTTDKRLWGRLAEYNKIVGAARVQQKRGKREKCDEPNLEKFYGSGCTDPTSEDQNYFGYAVCNATRRGEVTENIHGCVNMQKYAPFFDPSQFEKGIEDHTGFEPDIDPDGSTVFETYFDMSSTFEEAKLTLNYLKERGFVDRQTAEISHILTVLNAELGLFCEVEMHLIFENGGYVRDWFYIGSLPLHPYTAHPEMYFFDVCWYVALSLLVARELIDLRKIGIKRGMVDRFFWLNWVTICFAIYVTVVWHTEILKDSQLAEDALVNNDFAHTSSVGANLTHSERGEMHKQINVLQDTIKAGIGHMDAYRVNCILVCFLLLGQLFEVFLGNPRLSTMVLTFSNATVDLMHFLFVASFVFIAYAYSGVILFGHQMAEFRTMPKSMVTCFLFLLGENLGIYHDFYWVQPMMSPIWFFSYLIFAAMVLLNCFLAIVMDSYETTHELASKRDISTTSLTVLLLQDLGRHISKIFHIPGVSYVTTFYLWVLVQYRIRSDANIGRRIKNPKTGKLERWISAKDMVAASQGWRIPEKVQRNGGCCVRYRNGASRSQHSESGVLSQFSMRIEKSLSSWKGKIYPTLSHGRAKEAILFFHSCHGTGDDDFINELKEAKGDLLKTTRRLKPLG